MERTENNQSVSQSLAGIIAGHLVHIHTSSWIIARSPRRPSGQWTVGSCRQSMFGLNRCWKNSAHWGQIWMVHSMRVLLTCRTSSGFREYQDVVGCTSCSGRSHCLSENQNIVAEWEQVNTTRHKFKCVQTTHCWQMDYIRAPSTGREGPAVQWRKLVSLWIQNWCSLSQSLWQPALFQGKIGIH